MYEMEYTYANDFLLSEFWNKKFRGLKKNVWIK